MKPKSQWSGAHVRLKRLYEARVPAGMTQRDFAKKYDIGTQSMVAQYLNGDRPLNFEAAVKFAQALGVTVYDISPEMGDWIKDKLVPALGKPLRRAAVVLLAFLLQQFASPDASAALSHNAFSGRDFFAKSLNTLHIATLRRFLSWLSALLDTFRPIFGNRDNSPAR